MRQNRDLQKISFNLWETYKEKRELNSEKWFSFLLSLFNYNEFKTVNFDSIYSYKNTRLELLTSKDELMVFVSNAPIEERLSLIPLIKIINESYEHDKHLLILTPSSKGFEIYIIFISKSQSYSNIKTIKFKKGIIPIYFLNLFKNYSPKISPIELLKTICNIKSLETEFLNYLLRNYDKPDDYKKEYTFIHMVISLIYSKLISFESIEQAIKSERKKSRFISIPSFLSIVKNHSLLTNELEYYFNDILALLTQISASQFIDLDLIYELSIYFPFSWVEPSLYYQEVAITPLTLSYFEENYFVSNYKKKMGKYYTNLDDADFIAHLAALRFLERLNPSLEAKMVFNWINSDRRFTSEPDKNFNQEFRIPSSEINVLDPSCGSGMFLICITRLFIYLSELCQKRIQLKLNLWGFDRERSALLVTRLRLLFLLMNEAFSESFSNKIENNPLNLQINFENLINEDFLLYNHENKYDLIISNPPFVRQEDIGTVSNSSYKRKLVQKVRAISGTETSFDRKSDLYVYFCLIGLSMLKKGGILAYITSNAWLEVKYGKTLQNFLLDSSNAITIFEVIQRSRIRLWQDIGINSIILICQKAGKGNNSDNNALFVDSEVNFCKIPYKSLQEGIVQSKSYEDEFYRVEKISRDELFSTYKWAGTFLRTKKHERKILCKLGSIGVPLHQLADVRFGIKTGANNFFHLQILKIESIKYNHPLVSVRNNLNYKGYIERKYLLPLIKSPSHFKTFSIPSEIIPQYWLFYCLATPTELKGSMAWKYIQWGEKINVTIQQGLNSGKTVQGFSSIKSVSKRKQWYSLPEYPIPTLMWTKSYHDKSGCFLNLAKVVPDQRFYGIIVKDDKNIPLIFTYLNSSLVWALMESQGNTNMGYGVLDTNVYWLKNVHIPIQALKEETQIIKLKNGLMKVEERPSIGSFSQIRKDIDEFYAQYLDLDSQSLEYLNKYIARSVKNRLS